MTPGSPPTRTARTSSGTARSAPSPGPRRDPPRDHRGHLPAAETYYRARGREKRVKEGGTALGRPSLRRPVTAGPGLPASARVGQGRNEQGGVHGAPPGRVVVRAVGGEAGHG